MGSSVQQPLMQRLAKHKHTLCCACSGASTIGRGKSWQPHAVAHSRVLAAQLDEGQALVWLAVVPGLQQPLTLRRSMDKRTTLAIAAFPLQLPHLDDWQWQVMAPCVQQQAPVPEARRI